MKKSIIAALGEDRVIGKNNQTPWHIPDDLAHFRKLTVGFPVILGRKTYESILKNRYGEPLDQRENIVISSSNVVVPPGVHVVPDLQAAFDLASIYSEEVFVIGGGQVYKEALPFADKLYLTLIRHIRGGDTDIFFPPYEDLFRRTTDSKLESWKGYIYEYAEFEKK